VELNDGGVRHRGRGALLGAAAGLIALVAVTAGVVVALGSSSGNADASPRASAPGPAGTTGAAAPSSEPSEPSEPSDPASDPATAAPSASASAQRASGTVEHGVHSGDLRFFLLPAPTDADVYGDPDGSPYTAEDAAAGAANPSDAKAALKTYGFRSGAYRTYLTGDGVYEVTARLLRFGSAGQATAYYAQHTYDGGAIALDDTYPARAYRLTSDSAESTNAAVAVSHQGDVHITLTLTGSRSPSGALIQRLLDSQYQRLKTGH
jgi:hypothetical protein